MKDDFLTRDWADHHAKSASAFGNLFETIATSLARVHRYHYDAPWRSANFR